MTACGWLVETGIAALRDPRAALPFCQRAVDRTEGKDSEALIRLSTAQNLLGNRQDAIATLEKALSMIPATELGKPKSRQRESVEGYLAAWRRAEVKKP